MAGGVLALDIAKGTGWAHWEAPGRVTYGSYRVPDGGRFGRQLRNFGFWLDGMLLTMKPGRLVYEAPLIRMDRGGGEMHRAGILMGLVAVTCLVAEGRDVAAVEPTNNQTVRKHFLGSARGVRADLKERTMAVCKALGWSPQNDNAADALAILHWALHRYRYDHKLPTTAMFYARPAEEAA